MTHPTCVCPPSVGVLRLFYRSMRGCRNWPIRDALLFRRAKQFGMVIFAFVSPGLYLLNRDAVIVGPGVLANTRHQPGDLHVGLASRDRKLIESDLARDIDRGIATQAGQLVAEIAIERSEPVRQGHDSLTIGIEDGHSIIDILHIWGLYKGVVQALVRRVERMIDQEAAATLREGAGHIDSPIKQCCSSSAAIRIKACAVRTVGVDAEAIDGGTIVLAEHPCGPGTSGIAVHPVITAAGAVDADAVGAIPVYTVAIDARAICAHTIRRAATVLTVHPGLRPRRRNACAVDAAAAGAGPTEPYTAGADPSDPIAGVAAPCHASGSVGAGGEHCRRRADIAAKDPIGARVRCSRILLQEHARTSSGGDPQTGDLEQPEEVASAARGRNDVRRAFRICCGWNFCLGCDTGGREDRQRLGSSKPVHNDGVPSFKKLFNDRRSLQQTRREDFLADDFHRPYPFTRIAFNCGFRLYSQCGTPSPLLQLGHYLYQEVTVMWFSPMQREYNGNPAVDMENCFHWKPDEQPSHLFSRKHKIGVKHTSTVAFLLRRDIANTATP